MGIRVPGAERQDQIDTPEVPTPKTATPVEGAYGTGIAAAQVQAGQQVQSGAVNVAERIIQQNLWTQQANLYQSREDYRNAVQGSLYDSSMTTIKDGNGQEHEVPNGVLNRQGFAAQGATAEFDSKSAALKQQFMSQFTTPRMQAMAARQFDGITSVYRGQVAEHEANQIKDATAGTFLSSTMNEVKAASSVDNTDGLNTSITNTQNAYMHYGAFKGLDPETIQKNMNQWTAKAIDNSVTNTLATSGNLDKAQSLLDSVQGRIGVDDYNNISNKLTKGYETMQRTATRMQDITQNKNAMNVLTGISSGQLDWSKLNDIDNMQVPEPFKMAVKTALQSNLPANVDEKNLGYVPVKDQQFAQHMSEVMAGTNQNEIVNSMTDALNNYGHGKISQTDLNIVAKLAVMRGQSLPCKEDQATGQTIDPKQVPVDAGINAINAMQAKSGNIDSSMHSQYLNAVASGTDPKDALSAAVKTNVLKNYPNAITLDKTPDTVGSASQGLTSMIPDDKGKPEAAYKIDGDTGMVISKSEREGATLKTGGVFMQDAHGNKAVVYPDKSFEEEK